MSSEQSKAKAREILVAHDLDETLAVAHLGAVVLAFAAALDEAIAEEREACARECDIKAAICAAARSGVGLSGPAQIAQHAAVMCAVAIRARARATGSYTDDELLTILRGGPLTPTPPLARDAAEPAKREEGPTREQRLEAALLRVQLIAEEAQEGTGERWATRVERTARAALDEARAEERERAAAWHDEQIYFIECAASREDCSNYLSMEERKMIEWHRKAAAAIRARAAAEPAAREEGPTREQRLEAALREIAAVHYCDRANCGTSGHALSRKARDALAGSKP